MYGEGNNGSFFLSYFQLDYTQGRGFQLIFLFSSKSFIVRHFSSQSNERNDEYALVFKRMYEWSEKVNVRVLWCSRSFFDELKWERFFKILYRYVGPI